MSRPAPRHLKQQPNLLVRALPGATTGLRGTALATGAALSVPTSLGGIAFAAGSADAAGYLAPKAASATVTAPQHSVKQARSSTVVLRYGSTSSHVKMLQTKLGGIAVDGSFGPATLRAVKAFQSKKGLSVDGVVGPKTWAALGSGTASTKPAPNKCTVTVLRYGSTGGLVKTLQGRLRISADGNFGPQTLSAVKSYQKNKGLSADGVVGPSTWSSLGGFPCGTGGGGGTGSEGGEAPADPNASYKLPFPAGASHKITQSPSGTFSHDDRYSKYAIDFGMPTGSTVVASRSGKVYKAGWDAYGGGNSVMVRDSTGYCMQYNHLSSISVGSGQSVGQGQRVGYAGSTGNSTGPHLHWGLVTCSGYVSVQVPRTVERGTSYPVGVYAKSQNG